MSFCTWESEEHFKDHFCSGKYVCVNCGYELFSSQTKFEHHSPWPAFSKTIHEDSVSKKPDFPERKNALKVSCGKCGLGLGHEFLKDGPDKKDNEQKEASHENKESEMK